MRWPVPRALRERAAPTTSWVQGKRGFLPAPAGERFRSVHGPASCRNSNAQIDAWPNADSGFHAIEAKLFGAGRTDRRSRCRGARRASGRSSRQACPRHAVDAAEACWMATVRLAYEVGESKGRMAANRGSAEPFARRLCATTSPGIDFAYRTIFADVLKAADCRARPTRWRAGSSSSTRSSPHPTCGMSMFALCAAPSEELVIALQAGIY